MLHGATEAVRIEDPGTEKAEFVVTVGSRRELHQVKRSHPRGKWTLAALCRDGLLRAIGNQLMDNDDRFVFGSGSDARELSELCEAASEAESTEEFEHRFLASKDRKQRFERLRNCWGCDVPTAIALLRRIEVRTIGERDLEEKARWGVSALFVADPGNVLAELRRVVEDSVHRTIGRKVLVEELAKRGYLLRRITRPEHAGLMVEEATNRYLEGAKRKLIQQKLVPRAASETVLLRLDGTTATDSVLTGRAGSGKTACVVELVDRLLARETPVLAFRLDRGGLLSASTTTDLGQQLGLEESPVLVLAAVAETAGRPVVLIVDQLDTVSTMSGRSSGAFDLVVKLLDEVRGTRARAVIHTVVVCRAFDWKNDPGLRQLMPDEHSQVDVTEFSIDEVNTIITSAGFDAAVFHSRQLELLRLPQNLSLFLEAGFDTARTPAFDTAIGLFGRYWKEKQRSVENRVAPLPDQWMKVMEILCDRMTCTQRLSVPHESLDTVSPAYVDQLTSEGVLTFDGRDYGFGHESFFDYCFARLFFSRFFSRSDSLVSFLKGSEQHLFRRAQVRQVLAYLHDADLARYVQELAALLTDDGIRTHLKDLAFALHAEVTDPTEEEWAIWEQWIAPALTAIKAGTQNLARLSALAWRRFLGSPSCFAGADRRGMIESWLASNNNHLLDTVVNYLTVHQPRMPDRVAALLEPYADQCGDWPMRLRTLMRRADHHTSRRFFDLLLHLVDNGTLDEASMSAAANNPFQLILHDIGGNRPEWVPEVLSHRLRRRVAVIRATGQDLRGSELFDYDDLSAQMIATSAANASAEYVEHVLPTVLDISDSTLTDSEPPKHDAVWPILIQTEYPQGEDACLSGLAKALAALARDGAARTRYVIRDLHRRDTHVANHLLLALYRGGAARYADEAVLLLCEEPWRFKCGFSDSLNWCAMELIRAVVPYCTVDNRDKLETAILQLKISSEGYPYEPIGHTSFDLLSAIPVALRSSRANARYRELARKFGDPTGEPSPITVREVPSPIQKSAAKKMTDDQWLRAIEKYPAERTTYFPLKGGALQLAQVLEMRVREEPDRFAHLSLKFPADANSVYIEHTLTGLKRAVVGHDLKLQVCRKAFTESPERCGKSISDVLGNIENPLPDDAVQMLHWLATEHEDPATEAWREDAGCGQAYYNGEIHRNGINTTRRRAADAIRNLILTDPAYIDRFRPTLDLMIRDRSAAVLSCVGGTLQAVASHDRALGMRLFKSMDLTEDGLLATRHVYEFVRRGLHDSFAELRPVVERMFRSSEPEVCEAGARLASIAASKHESAADLVDEALHGAPRQRLGVAQVAAANVAVPECRAWCEEKLVMLFNDCDSEVRNEAATCFRYLRDQALDTYGELIEVFCTSRAFAGGSFWLLRALEDSLKRLPGMTCMVCERFLDHNTGDTLTIAKLSFRTYQQHQNDEWGSRSLDLIDRVCLEGTGAGGEFEQFER